MAAARRMVMLTTAAGSAELGEELGEPHGGQTDGPRGWSGAEEADRRECCRAMRA
jgi:hypothetical protein